MQCGLKRFQSVRSTGEEGYLLILAENVVREVQVQGHRDGTTQGERAVSESGCGHLQHCEIDVPRAM